MKTREHYQNEQNGFDVIDDNDNLLVACETLADSDDAQIALSLLKAAPDLLAACEAVHLSAVWDGKSVVKMEYTIPNEAVLKIAAAIAKARGV